MDNRPVQIFSKMKKDTSLLKLRQEINKRLKTATDSLLHDDKTRAKENIEWIELATTLAGKAESKSDKRRMPVIIGLISIFLIGLGLILKIPKTNIAIDVVAKNVVLKLKKEWLINNRFSSPEITIDNLKEVYSPGAGIKVVRNQPFSIDLKGEDIAMNGFRLSPDAEFAIQLQDSIQYFKIKNDSLVTDIQVSKAHININDGQVDTDLNFEIPQLFNIRSFKSVAVPVSIMLSDTSGWSFRDISISGIDFLEESSQGSGKFVSSIISANVKILETDKETRLEEGDWLLLKKLQNRRIQITKSNSVLKIHIEGEVAKIRAGSELFEKNLKPTIIEYLYYTKSFAFFWSCIVFIWSLLWSFKNTLFIK